MARPPFLPSVTSFSTIGRNSLAFGSVVTICSCLISAAHMLANIALPMLGGAVELPMNLAVTHVEFLNT